jgi:hypothetical protein
MANVEATIRDQSTSALVPVEGVAVTSSPTNPGVGQVLRQVSAIGDGAGGTNYATVSNNALSVNVTKAVLVGAYYSVVGASSGPTGGSPIVISSQPVLFCGIKHLSTSAVGTNVVITIYDSNSTASGSIIGQYSPGASQSLLDAVPVITTYGIVVAITGGALNNDGGINVYHS